MTKFRRHGSALAPSEISELSSSRLPLRPVRPVTQADASLALGPVVYFAQLSDGRIKIGWTANLAQRRRSFRIPASSVLAFVPGDRDLERTYLDRFSPHLAEGREIFDPAPELIGEINRIRQQLGRIPIEV